MKTQITRNPVIKATCKRGGLVLAIAFAALLTVVGCETGEFDSSATDPALEETESALLLSADKTNKKKATADEIEPADELEEVAFLNVTPYGACMAGCEPVGDFRFCHTKCQELVIDGTAGKVTKKEAAKATQNKQEATAFLFADVSEDVLATVADRTPYEVCMDYCMQSYSFNHCHKKCSGLVNPPKALEPSDTTSPQSMNADGSADALEAEEAAQMSLEVAAAKTPYEVCMDYCMKSYSFNYCNNKCSKLVIGTKKVEASETSSSQASSTGGSADVLEAEEAAQMSLEEGEAKTPYEVCMDYCMKSYSFNYCNGKCSKLVTGTKKKDSANSVESVSVKTQ